MSYARIPSVPNCALGDHPGAGDGWVHSATAIDGPGRDYASDSFALKANQSGESLVQHLATGQKYCLDQAQLAHNALDDYLGVEHTNVRQIVNTQQTPHSGI